jgi:hypothetical protein
MGLWIRKAKRGENTYYYWSKSGGGHIYLGSTSNPNPETIKTVLEKLYRYKRRVDGQIAALEELLKSGDDVKPSPGGRGSS